MVYTVNELPFTRYNHLELHVKLLWIIKKKKKLVIHHAQIIS